MGSRLRLASWAEGTTFAVLVCIAVPLKHFFDVPAATVIVGPIHGGGFLAYVWTVGAIVIGEGDWIGSDIARLLLAAFVPFGAFVNVAFLKAKERAAVCV